MNFDGRAAVFEFIRLRQRPERQLALLADRHETQAQFVSENRPDDETARIEPGNVVDSCIDIALHQQVDQHAQRAPILQHRRDIAELHTGLRPVGHRANRLLMTRRIERRARARWT